MTRTVIPITLVAIFAAIVAIAQTPPAAEPSAPAATDAWVWCNTSPLRAEDLQAMSVENEWTAPDISTPSTQPENACWDIHCQKIDNVIIKTFGGPDHKIVWCGQTPMSDVAFEQMTAENQWKDPEQGTKSWVDAIPISNWPQGNAWCSVIVLPFPGPMMLPN